MHGLIVLPALISLTFPPPVSVCVGGGGGGRREGGITCWVAHVHARCQRERPNLCSYSYMRLNGSELVGCWGSEYKGLAPDTMPGRCSTCDSIQMHTGVGIQ